jgi:hypothetical protein
MRRDCLRTEVLPERNLPSLRSFHLRQGYGATSRRGGLEFRAPMAEAPGQTESPPTAGFSLSRTKA